MLNVVLRLLRISQDLSIRELSDKMKISSSYISDIERAVKKPSLDVIGKYSDALGVSKATILYFEEECQRTQYTYQELLLKMLQKISV